MCDIIVRWQATPGQLTALGTALWRWCTRATGATGIYRYLDNQALADLIAGELPESDETERRGVHLWVRDESAQGRQATLDGLRREIPADAVADIVVDGVSWNLIDRGQATRDLSGASPSAAPLRTSVEGAVPEADSVSIGASNGNQP
jgi:hypothetical protein